MCIDFADLNKACPKDDFPLTRIDKVVDDVANSQLMSLLNCFSGYHQILMRKEDEEKTLEFPSITLTIKYLNSIGISADRNQLAKHLDTNKSYKGYIFSKA